MNELTIFRNRLIRRRFAPVLAALGWLCLSPCPALAQSAALMKTYQGYESAKAANKADEVFKYGDEAVTLTEQSGDRHGAIELLCNLGEYAGQAGRTALALQYYEHALAMLSADQGAQSPDLVPILTAICDLQFKDGKYPEAAAAQQRVLEIEKALYGPHHQNVAATLGRLKAILLADGDEAAADKVEAELAVATHPPERALPSFQNGGNRRYKQNQGFATVKVFYGTNRAPSGDTKPAVYYGKARGDLQYGYLTVTIPQIHKEAELETQPRWLDYVFFVDQASLRTRYVLLDRVTPLPKDEFTRALRQNIGDSPSKDVFVFVHGFNNSFEDAARRAAQMAYDLDFDGTPVLYSWPSQGSTTAYTVDEATVSISGRKLADFLDTVVGSSGAQRVHVLAHSMGNRALIEALQTLLARRAPDKRQHLFGQVVFTAPDVDRDYFVDTLESLRGAADRVTLYASSNDYALRSSQLLHGAPRAGTAGDVIVRLAGLDTIDMSAVPADALGHSYFAANSGAIFDVFRLLWKGDPPPQRCGMSDRKAGDKLTVWWFNADQCKGDDMLVAGVMLKRFGNLARDHVLSTIAGLTDPSQKQEWSQILKRLDVLLPPPAAGAAK